MKKTSPEIRWLMEKWGLPEAACESVAAWLAAEAQGDTACPLARPVSSWGHAAAPAGETSDSPLVLVEHAGTTFLQSRLVHETEREIARRLLALAADSSPLPHAAPAPESLFPGAQPTDPQVEAARTALERHLAIITGGPGTGKTYTLARILALFVSAGLTGIRLAAPSGKAADRMKSAVTQSLDGLPESFAATRDALLRAAETSATLHALLGYFPDSGSCRYGPENPLPCDVLIVDECSMVDVHLWRALLEALPDGARLVLLGDPNQLASVGQGDVFAGIVRAAAATDSPLHAVRVHLTEARRFRDRPAILAFARALETSDAAAARALLEDVRGSEGRDGLAWLEASGGALPCSEFPAPVLDALGHVACADSPAAALDALARVCVLTAQRNFFVGSLAMSRQIDAHFQHREGTRNHPVIINRNDPETRLRNGTVGVLHTAPDGTRRAFFPGADGTLAEFPTSRLPDFSPAWAITIHRSQGSEYDNVLVILPREESPMATRELLYTAITRARRNVFVAGDLASAEKAARTPSARRTLLEAFLAGGS